MVLLRIEGGVLFAVTILCYRESHASWALFAALLLAPDLSFAGYAAGVKIGAAVYNLMHTLIGIGTQSASLVHPREVFGPAIREGAVSIIVAHNHPSGDPEPSREDMRLTRQLAEAGNLLDIRLHDHLIVGNGTWTWVSMAQRGVL